MKFMAWNLKCCNYNINVIIKNIDYTLFKFLRWLRRIYFFMHTLYSNHLIIIEKLYYLRLNCDWDI